MSRCTRPALLAACFAALLSAAPAHAAPPSADGTKAVDATGRDQGIETALEALSRMPQADPEVFSDQVAAILKTRHETAKNSISNVR